MTITKLAYKIYEKQSNHAHFTFLRCCDIAKKFKWAWSITVMRYVKINHATQSLVQKQVYECNLIQNTHFMYIFQKV